MLGNLRLILFKRWLYFCDDASGRQVNKNYSPLKHCIHFTVAQKYIYIWIMLLQMKSDIAMRRHESWGNGMWPVLCRFQVPRESWSSVHSVLAHIRLYSLQKPGVLAFCPMFALAISSVDNLTTLIQRQIPLTWKYMVWLRQRLRSIASRTSESQIFEQLLTCAKYLEIGKNRNSIFLFS